MKVAIIGGATMETEEVLALEKEGWEIWTINAIRPAWLNPRKIDRCFNLHRYAHLQRDWAQGLRAEQAWFEIFPEVPFYVIGKWPRTKYPSQIEFERSMMGPSLPRADYSSSSIDMMLRFAYTLGATDVRIFGINFFNESGEPISARACLEYWIGYFIGRGINVTIADDCALFLQYHYVKSRSQYGFDDIHMIEDRT